VKLDKERSEFWPIHRAATLSCPDHVRWVEPETAGYLSKRCVVAVKEIHPVQIPQLAVEWFGVVQADRYEKNGVWRKLVKELERIA
jgi:hypothetical protein